MLALCLDPFVVHPSPRPPSPGSPLPQLSRAACSALAASFPRPLVRDSTCNSFRSVGPAPPSSNFSKPCPWEFDSISCFVSGLGSRVQAPSGHFLLSPCLTPLEWMGRGAPPSLTDIKINPQFPHRSNGDSNIPLSEGHCES